MIADKGCAERGCPMHNSRETHGVVMVPKREWIGLTKYDYEEVEEWVGHVVPEPVFYSIEAKLKERNHVS